MTNFELTTYENVDDTFNTMLANSNYNTSFALFESENFTAEFAKFIGITEDELWKHEAFVEWYNEIVDELEWKE